MIRCLAKRSVSCLTLGNYNHVADFEQQDLNIIPILLCSNVTLYDIVVNFVNEHASILLAPWAQRPLLLCSYSSTREEWVGTGPSLPPSPPLPSAPPSLQEMIYQEPRETLTAALMSLKEAIPELSVAMQNFIRDKRNAELKVYLVKTLDTPCMHVVILTCILRILSSRFWSHFY